MIFTDQDRDMLRVIAERTHQIWVDVAMLKGRMMTIQDDLRAAVTRITAAVRQAETSIAQGRANTIDPDSLRPVLDDLTNLAGELESALAPLHDAAPQDPSVAAGGAASSGATLGVRGAQGSAPGGGTAGAINPPGLMNPAPLNQPGQQSDQARDQGASGPPYNP